MPATYEPIATQTLSSGATSVTFNSISGSYSDLVLVSSAQGTNATDTFTLIFNGDTGSNYSITRLYGLGSGSGASNRYTSQPNMAIGDYMPDSTYFFPVIAQIQNYSNSTTYKTVLSRVNAPDNFVGAIVGLWRNTAAITSITIRESAGAVNLKAGSTFTLYGIAAA